LNCAHVKQYSVSSPGLTVRSSIPEAARLEPMSRGVLGRPVKPGDDSGEDVAHRSRGTKCPSVASFATLSIQRAQGAPDAGRTREPCVQRKVHFAHASINRAAETTGTPCAMGLRLIRDLLGAPGFLATVASSFVTRSLIPASGGRDRTISPSHRTHFVLHAGASIASRANVRDDREAPLWIGAGWTQSIMNLR
jgi:hypothetical protein